MLTHEPFDSPARTNPEPHVPLAVHRLTRRLLNIGTDREAAELTAELVAELGALTGEGTPCVDCVAEIEISFSDGIPVFPCAPPDSVARRMIEAYLPASSRTPARPSNSAAGPSAWPTTPASTRSTGLLERSAMGRLMARLQHGDLLIALDLDDFKKVNAEDGRAAGDAVLRAFARALRSATRANESCARMRSDEFLVVLYQADAAETAMIFLDRLRRKWREMATSLPAFSAGIAQVSGEGWRPRDARSRPRPPARQGRPGGLLGHRWRRRLHLARDLTPQPPSASVR